MRPNTTHFQQSAELIRDLSLFTILNVGMSATAKAEIAENDDPVINAVLVIGSSVRILECFPFKCFTRFRVESVQRFTRLQ